MCSHFVPFVTISGLQNITYIITVTVHNTYSAHILHHIYLSLLQIFEVMFPYTFIFLHTHTYSHQNLPFSQEKGECCSKHNAKFSTSKPKLLMHTRPLIQTTFHQQFAYTSCWCNRALLYPLYKHCCARHNLQTCPAQHAQHRGCPHISKAFSRLLMFIAHHINKVQLLQSAQDSVRF